MSAVQIVDEALVEKIRKDLTDMANSFPRHSLAALIKSEHFHQVVKAIAADIDTRLPDFEAALIISLGSRKAGHPEWFDRAVPSPLALSRKRK